MHQTNLLDTVQQSCLPIRYSPNAPLMHKCWKVAQTRYWDKKQLEANKFIGKEYMLILNEIKLLFKQEELLAFERDYREDKSASAQAMHCFVTPNFYFYLECNLAFDYKVEYAFGYCKYEERIRILLNSLALDDCLIEVSLPLPFYIFFKMIRNAQHIQYFHTLE